VVCLFSLASGTFAVLSQPDIKTVVKMDIDKKDL
jgi:hypothetical protein